MLMVVVMRVVMRVIVVMRVVMSLMPSFLGNSRSSRSGRSSRSMVMSSMIMSLVRMVMIMIVIVIVIVVMSSMVMSLMRMVMIMVMLNRSNGSSSILGSREDDGSGKSDGNSRELHCCCCVKRVKRVKDDGLLGGQARVYIYHRCHVIVTSLQSSMSTSYRTSNFALVFEQIKTPKVAEHPLS